MHIILKGGAAMQKSLFSELPVSYYGHRALYCVINSGKLLHSQHWTW
jgi:hypothetical protein